MWKEYVRNETRSFCDTEKNTIDSACKEIRELKEAEKTISATANAWMMAGGGDIGFGNVNNELKRRLNNAGTEALSAFESAISKSDSKLGVLLSERLYLDIKYISEEMTDWIKTANEMNLKINADSKSAVQKWEDYCKTSMELKSNLFECKKYECEQLEKNASNLSDRELGIYDEIVEINREISRCSIFSIGKKKKLKDKVERLKSEGKEIQTQKDELNGKISSLKKEIAKGM